MTCDGSREGIAELRAVARDLALIAERLTNLAGELATAHVNEVEGLHDDIEAARRRWWHRLLGIRWEMTGWSRKGSGWDL